MDGPHPRIRTPYSVLTMALMNLLLALVREAWQATIDSQQHTSRWWTLSEELAGACTE